MSDWIPRREWLTSKKTPQCVIVTVAEAIEATRLTEQQLESWPVNAEHFVRRLSDGTEEECFRIAAEFIPGAGI